MLTDIRARNLLGRPGGVKRAKRVAMRLAAARFCWLVVLAAGCTSSNGKPKSAGGSGDGERLVLFATTEVKGQLEPCGCNSDPMGDISRIVKLVADARADGQPVVVVD